jgi:protein involved in polysaccharide export with SLBB domain
MLLAISLSGDSLVHAQQALRSSNAGMAARAAAAPAPPYRLSAGDVVDVKFAYNPELNETVRLRPDGCISLQLVGDVHALALTPMELAARINELYTRHVRRPDASIIVRELAPQKAYVGGEVVAPGVVELRHGLTSLQAILQLGGVRPSAKLESVLLMSYAGGERAEVRTLNLTRMLDGRDPDPLLSPYDVIFVPRSRIAKIGLFVEQYVDSLIPRSLMFPYNLNTSVTVK